MKYILFSSLLLACLLSACSWGRPNCFDKKLFEERKNSFCTEDCPGVTGCDGKRYCNECVANRQGIRIVQ